METYRKNHQITSSFPFTWEHLGTCCKIHQYIEFDIKSNVSKFHNTLYFCRFAKKIGVNIKDLTTPHFAQSIDSKLATIDIVETSQELDTDVGTLELIINAFKQKKYDDNVISFCKPVYSVAVQNIDQLKDGMALTGT